MERSSEDIIKDRYSALRRQIHPGYTPNDAKCGKDWDDAAAIVKVIGADPELFVDAQFHAMSFNNKNPFPWPSNLHDRNAVDNYSRYMESFASTPEARLEQQNILLRAQLDGLSLQDIDVALSKSVLPFKSWFRVLMCSDKNLPRFLSVWGEYARKQMRSDKSFFKFLQNKYAARAHRLL
jgi:hypothetical protein